VLSRARSYVTESLFRNSLSLVLNMIMGALCGYGALGLLTHLYSSDAVGLSAVAVSATALIVTLVQLGTNFSLPRFLPTSKDRVALVNTLHTGILLCAVIGSVIFLVLPVSRKMYALGGWLFVPVFIGMTCVQAGVTFLSFVLVSERASGKLAAANSVPNIIKVAAPPALTALGNLGAFLARMISNLFAYVIIAFVLARRGYRFRPALRLSAVRELGSFSIGMYAASTVGGLPQLLLPIVVLSRLGGSGTAYWSISYTVATLLYQIPSVITQALLPEISLRRTARKALLRKATLLIAALAFPALAVAYFAAPIALIAFGHKYVVSALPSLRWLIAAGFVTSLNYTTGAILFLGKKSGLIGVVNAVDAILVLVPAAVWATSPKEVAIIWFAGDVANTVLFGFFAYLALREVGFRYEDLGGVQASPVPATAAAEAPMPSSLQRAFDVLYDIAERQRVAAATRATGGSHTGAFEVLSMIAERQQEAALHGPAEYHRATEPGGLYSVLMFQEAERERAWGASRNDPGAPERPVTSSGRRRE
jgi:O-antigen/teichoic acid export membrane protein